ncbi:MAG: cation transporter [Oscillospiraceae bacterium]|nr:cation transporter [Candidatus Limimonas coprohippi]MCQ2488211.1 cation diffusion facilitator family transporter [Clostridia bacterium]
MVTLLSKIFIKNSEDIQSPAVRRAFGTLCSIIGIFLNILMFAGKYIAGTIAHSVAIVADAFNNLSDAASSIITLLGFRLAGKKPDPDHPFGHGRIEYLSGVAVSLMILVMGFELMKSSVTKIFNPEPVEASWLAGGIMVVAILIKLYMAFYNSKVGKKIDSAAMAAVAADSLSDTISTVVVLVAMIASKFTDFNIDAYAGIFVALLILKTGIESVRDTIAPLLGQAPSKEFVEQIESITLEQEHILAIHDLIVHDYGPGRVFISLHAEVPGDEDVFVLHDEIDNAEVELKKRLGCEATIHLDPVCVNDEDINKMKETVGSIINKFDEQLSFHDFRMVPGETHTNLIFDVVVPAKYKMSNDAVHDALKAEIEEHCFKCFAVITVEQSYI